MKLTRPLCFLDIESATAKKRPDAAIDRIICLAIKKLSSEPKAEAKTWLFNPQIEITPENAAIHGYTNEKVARYPFLGAVQAEDIREFIEGCDLAGFNCINYDVPLLWEECFRADIEIILDGVHIVDAGNIFKKKEERTLTAALKFYCGKDHTGAHGAEADVDATIDVLAAQIGGVKWAPSALMEHWHADKEQWIDPTYEDLFKMTVPELAAYSKMDDRVDLFGTIVRNEKGEAVFNTKRNQGMRVLDDIGYATWFLKNDFPAHTKRTIERILTHDPHKDQAALF